MAAELALEPGDVFVDRDPAGHPVTVEVVGVFRVLIRYVDDTTQWLPIMVFRSRYRLPGAMARERLRRAVDELRQAVEEDRPARLLLDAVEGVEAAERAYRAARTPLRAAA